jgi:hypothetical protein
MSVITKRLSVPELSQQILEMAKTGVYRESVLEALQPMATKKQIRVAIAHAKRFGLHSVANLRDPELGTYYQLDLAKYQSLQHAIYSPAHFGKDADLLQRVMDATQTVQQMLAIAGSLAILLSLAGVTCLFTGQGQLGLGLLSSAASAFGIWALQHTFARKIPFQK